MGVAAAIAARSILRRAGAAASLAAAVTRSGRPPSPGVAVRAISSSAARLNASCQLMGPPAGLVRQEGGTGRQFVLAEATQTRRGRCGAQKISIKLSVIIRHKYTTEPQTLSVTCWCRSIKRSAAALRVQHTLGAASRHFQHGEESLVDGCAGPLPQLEGGGGRKGGWRRQREGPGPGGQDAHPPRSLQPQCGW